MTITPEHIIEANQAMLGAAKLMREEGSRFRTDISGIATEIQTILTGSFWDVVPKSHGTLSLSLLIDGKQNTLLFNRPNTT